MRKLFLLLCSFMLLFQAYAQRTVTGRVTDDKGDPIVGASITIKGSSNGTTTNNDGRYSLVVPANGRILVISAVGQTKQELSLGNQAVINASLANADQALDEVVVVGYGTRRRVDVTAAVSTIGSAKIKDLPVQSFDQALAGKASGLSITVPNGVLGNPPVIRIRGSNTISGSTLPLVIIDGIPSVTGDISTNLAANNPLGNINPNDIESVEVLKDAAATAIYGSRASNGVLLVTTKKGRAGKARVSYDAWVGSTKAFNVFEVLNANQYVEIKNEALRNNPGVIVTGQAAGSPLFFLDTINGQQVNTDWADEVYQTGLQHNHSLSVSGGNAGSTYYFSANYSKQKGILQTNEFERKQIRMNLTQKISEGIKIGGDFNFTRGNTQSPSSGSLPNTAFATAGSARLAFVTAPNVSPYRADGRYNIMGIDDAAQRNSFNQIGRNRNLFNSGFVNPTMIRDLNEITSANDQILANLFAEFKLAKGLSFRSQYGVNYQTVEDKIYYNPLHGDGIQTSATTDDGLVSNVLGKYNSTTFSNYFTYITSLREKHNFNLTAGHEENKYRVDRWGGQRSGASDLFFNDYQGSYTINDNPPQNLITENYLLSFFGRASYNFKNKYYLEGSVRRDGYSAFAPGKKWENYGGVSAGWTLSEEAFWKGGIDRIVNRFRLRASYGGTGNLSAVNNFGSLTQFSAAQYGQGYPTIFFAQAGNDNLTWEKSTKTDVGFVADLFNDRITAEVTYYRSDLTGLIINVPRPSSMGIPGALTTPATPNSVQENAAEMYNRGVEVSLTGRILRGGDFTWTSTLNLTTQKNEVTKLAPGVPEIIGNTQLERTNITRVGEPIGSFFVVRDNGVDPATGRRIFVNASGREVLFNFAAPAASRYTFRDDGTVAPAIDLGKDGVIAGNALPTVYGGFINNFAFKGFDLTIDAIYSFGNKVYFGSRAGLLDQRFWNNTTEVISRWQKPGDVTDIPRLVFNDNISNGSAFPISSNLYDGGFVKMRNIGLGYTLPAATAERIKMSSIRIYGQVQNAFTLTDYPGVDPEISSNGNVAITPGVDRNSIGQARSFTIGVNVGF